MHILYMQVPVSLVMLGSPVQVWAMTYQSVAHEHAVCNRLCSRNLSSYSGSNLYNLPGPFHTFNNLRQGHCYHVSHF